MSSALDDYNWLSIRCPECRAAPDQECHSKVRPDRVRVLPHRRRVAAVANVTRLPEADTADAT